MNLPPDQHSSRQSGSEDEAVQAAKSMDLEVASVLNTVHAMEHQFPTQGVPTGGNSTSMMTAWNATSFSGAGDFSTIHEAGSDSGGAESMDDGRLQGWTPSTVHNTSVHDRQADMSNVSGVEHVTYNATYDSLPMTGDEQAMGPSQPTQNSEGLECIFALSRELDQISGRLQPEELAPLQDAFAVVTRYIVRQDAYLVELINEKETKAKERPQQRYMNDNSVEYYRRQLELQAEYEGNLQAHINSLEAQLTFIRDHNRTNEERLNSSRHKLSKQVESLNEMLEKNRKDSDDLTRLLLEKDHTIDDLKIQLDAAIASAKRSQSVQRVTTTINNSLSDTTASINSSHLSNSGRLSNSVKIRKQREPMQEVLQKHLRHSGQQFTQLSARLESMRAELAREREGRARENVEFTRETIGLESKVVALESMVEHLQSELSFMANMASHRSDVVLGETSTINQLLAETAELRSHQTQKLKNTQSSTTNTMSETVMKESPVVMLDDTQVDNESIGNTSPLGDSAPPNSGPSTRSRSRTPRPRKSVPESMRAKAEALSKLPRPGPVRSIRGRQLDFGRRQRSLSPNFRSVRPFATIDFDSRGNSDPRIKYNRFVYTAETSALNATNIAHSTSTLSITAPQPLISPSFTLSPSVLSTPTSIRCVKDAETQIGEEQIILPKLERSHCSSQTDYTGPLLVEQPLPPPPPVVDLPPPPVVTTSSQTHCNTVTSETQTPAVREPIVMDCGVQTHLPLSVTIDNSSVSVKDDATEKPSQESICSVEDILVWQPVSPVPVALNASASRNVLLSSTGSGINDPLSMSGNSLKESENTPEHPHILLSKTISSASHSVVVSVAENVVLAHNSLADECNGLIRTLRATRSAAKDLKQQYKGEIHASVAAAYEARAALKAVETENRRLLARLHALGVAEDWPAAAIAAGEWAEAAAVAALRSTEGGETHNTLHPPHLTSSVELKSSLSKSSRNVMRSHIESHTVESNTVITTVTELRDKLSHLRISALMSGNTSEESDWQQVMELINILLAELENVSDVDQNTEELGKKIINAEKQIEELRDTLASEVSTSNLAKSELALAKAEVESMKQHIETIREDATNETTELRKKMEFVSAAYNDAKKEIEEYATKITLVLDDLSKANSTVTNLESALAATRKEALDLRQQSISIQLHTETVDNLRKQLAEQKTTATLAENDQIGVIASVNGGMDTSMITTAGASVASELVANYNSLAMKISALRTEAIAAEKSLDASVSFLSLGTMNGSLELDNEKQLVSSLRNRLDKLATLLSETVANSDSVADISGVTNHHSAAAKSSTCGLCGSSKFSESHLDIAAAAAAAKHPSSTQHNEAHDSSLQISVWEETNYLREQLSAAESRVAALSAELESMPASLAVASAERRVLEARLAKSSEATETRIAIVTADCNRQLAALNAFLEAERSEKVALQNRLQNQGVTVHQLTHHLKLLQGATEAGVGNSSPSTPGNPSNSLRHSWTPVTNQTGNPAWTSQWSSPGNTAPWAATSLPTPTGISGAAAVASATRVLATRAFQETATTPRLTSYVQR